MSFVAYRFVRLLSVTTAVVVALRASFWLLARVVGDVTLWSLRRNVKRHGIGVVD